MSRRPFYIAILMISVVLVMIGLDKILYAADVVNDRYHINPEIALGFFIVAEIIFNLGIFLILRGSGVFRIRLKEIRSFNLSGVKFEGQQVYVGFLLNRAAAILPWLYILISGWRYLPWYVIFIICTEIAIVLTIGFTLPIKHFKRRVAV